MATLIDSYSETNANSFGYGLSIYGQAFANTSEVTLYSAKFYLAQNEFNTVGGTMNVVIYAATGTLGSTAEPTGSVLATSESLDMITFPTTVTLQEFLFTGANKITLTSSTNYCVGMYLDYDSPPGKGDGILTYYDSTSPSHSGNYFHLSGTFEANSGLDTIFYVYADDGGTPAVIHHLGILGIGV